MLRVCGVCARKAHLSKGGGSNAQLAVIGVHEARRTHAGAARGEGPVEAVLLHQLLARQAAVGRLVYKGNVEVCALESLAGRGVAAGEEEAEHQKRPVE